jgi:hypothetical protein
LFWQESFHVSIQNYSKNHINAVIYSEALDVRWKFSGFYGNPESQRCVRDGSLGLSLGIWNFFLPSLGCVVGILMKFLTLQKREVEQDVRGLK